jgi:hypothetical protein
LSLQYQPRMSQSKAHTPYRSLQRTASLSSLFDTLPVSTFQIQSVTQAVCRSNIRINSELNRIESRFLSIFWFLQRENPQNLALISVHYLV